MFDHDSYSITASNEDGEFAIDGGMGAVTVKAAFNYAEQGRYALTVQADGLVVTASSQAERGRTKSARSVGKAITAAITTETIVDASSRL